MASDNPIERITDTFRAMVETGLFPLACDYNFCRELAYIIGKAKCSSIVETGTFKAETTRFLAAAFPDLDVFTCDVKQELVEAARALFPANTSVTVEQSSSPDFIKALTDGGKAGVNPFFFLDAHWYDYLPLNDELRLILASGRGIACIHDFKVPGAPEYGFDVYGDKTIGMDLILATLNDSGIPYRVYFPKPPNASLTKPFRNGTRIWNFASGEIEKYELRGRCYIVAGQPEDVVRVFDELVELGCLTAGGCSIPDAATTFKTVGSMPSRRKSLPPSRPRIDVVVPGDPVFSWNQREGWISAMSALGVLGQVYWVNGNTDSTSQFFQSIQGSSADFILMLCCDHHLCFLHDSPQKKGFWRKFPRPVICHSIERVIASPFPSSEEKSRSAAETFDAFIYIDEFAAGIFESSGKPSMWIPQYVDEETFRSTIPYDQRESKVFFRGQIRDSGVPGVYQDRQRLLAKLQDDPSFALSEAHRPSLTMEQAAALKGQYRFVLNAPANCPGYSSSLYEALACGCAVFQYALPPEEILSRNLFVPGRHFIEYDPRAPDTLKEMARYACSHWNDFRAVAELGREECLARHTIKKRVEEVISFVSGNWDAIAKTPPGPAGTAMTPEVHSFGEVAAKVAAVDCGRRNSRELTASLQNRPQNPLEQLIPPEIKNDEFYFLIERLCRQEGVKTVLEIGSSSGGGSTQAFISGMSQNPGRPRLYCMEVSGTRFKMLQQSYAHIPFVHCYNVSSVPATRFPSEREVELFYRWIPSALNSYPLEQVIGWLRQDIAYVKGAGVPQNGIQRVKQEQAIAQFDMVLIDGSEFLGSAELDEVYGAGYILLDDVNGFKNYGNYQRLSEDPCYRLVHENWNLRSGYAVFARN